MRLTKLLKKTGLPVLAAFLTMAAVACSSDDNGPESVDNGTVSGIVTDEQENPIEGVKVSLPATGASVTTGSTGEYTLNAVPMTSGIVLFEKEGYETTSVTVVAKRFTDKHATVNVSLVYANAVITGVVYDANAGNAPMAGVTVKVSDFQKAETDGSGRFELRNLTLQDYTVTFSKEGYPDVTKNVGVADFIDGTATIEATMGASEILRGLTKFKLMEAQKWYYNEYRGGRNAENYPHWDWACNYMCTLDFVGDFEEQNEGTTLRIRNSSDDQRNNPVDMKCLTPSSTAQN